MSTRKSQRLAKTPATPFNREHLSHHDPQCVMTDAGRRWPVGLMLCTLAFVVCILLTVTPLSRMPDPVLHHVRIGWGDFLAYASQWLPTNLGSTYQKSSASIEFFGLITLAFCLYCLGAWLVGRWTDETRRWAVFVCIWLGLILAGAIYFVTPGVREHDIEAYAGYSRLLAIYHANPYFVPFSAYPHDPVFPTDVWASVNAAYGPAWMVVCALLGWILKQPTPEAYIIGFRTVALTAHLLNTWLVGRILQDQGRSPRIRSLGMLLYGWSPLLLLESAQDAHLDFLMLVFVLLGILLAIRAEQRGELLLRARGYLPPILTLTMAVLVKFTMLPVLIAFLLLLGCKVLRPTAGSSLVWQEASGNWRVALRVLGLAVLVSVLLALAFYGPFWIGHSLHAIVASFRDNPAEQWAENSIMRSVINWWHLHPEQNGNPLLFFFRVREVWNSINYLVIVLCLVIGVRRLWAMPTMSTFLALILAMMCLVLLLTPWFFPWYISWIVALAVVNLPPRRSRGLWAFFFLALTFSYSVLTLYLFNEDLLGSHGYLNTLFDAGPPICAFLFCWWYRPNAHVSQQPARTADPDPAALKARN